MADIAEIDKQYNAILKKYGPKTETKANITKVPKEDLETSQLIDLAFSVFNEYQSGENQDTDYIIQTLNKALNATCIEIEKYHQASLLIEHNERESAITNQALLLHKERKPRENGGRKGRTHKNKEKLALMLLEKHKNKVINPKTNKKYTLADISVELDIPFETVRTWRKNHKDSNGKSIYQN